MIAFNLYGKMKVRYLVFKLCLFVGIAFLPNLQDTHAQSDRDAIGLTLSGGGAKGFAHIGVLHIIDSLGIKVDYITGTSMGSIIGGLYAVGYTASEIEEFALSVDWASTFSSRSELEDVHIRNRLNYNKHLVEIPFQDKKIVLSTGAIEGQKLWLLLEELFFHIREEEDFHNFDIPFACMATDLATGNSVIMNSGDIVSALRASMAIPAVFTSVYRENLRLIDGGVVNNFPVDVVKEMGATHVIGVNVSSGLKNAEEIRTPVDILMQMGFFKDAYMFRKNKEQTDLFIAPNLDGYETSSFSSVEEIIERGKWIGRVLIPELLEMAEKFPVENKQKNKTSRKDKIVVSKIEFEGLNQIPKSVVRNYTEIHDKDTISVKEINRAISRLYATSYFSRINYTYTAYENDPEKKKLTFTFIENPQIFLRMGLNYNSFMGVGLIGGISTNRLLLNNLSGDFMFRLGDQSAYRLSINYLLGENFDNWVNFKAEGFRMEFPFNEDFSTLSFYRQGFNSVELSFNKSVGKNSFLSAGITRYRQSLRPSIQSDFVLSGRNRASYISTSYQLYTLDRHAFARRGHNLNLRTSYFFNQDPKIEAVANDSTFSDVKDLGIVIRNFIQLHGSYEYYKPTGQNSSYFFLIQGGYNINYTQGFLNMFNLGGTHKILRDQITFSGISEYEILTPSILALGVGANINVWSQIYITPQLNAAFYDFDVRNISEINSNNLVFGVGLTAGLITPLGPIKVSTSFSPQTNSLLGYINMGWNF